VKHTRRSPRHNVPASEVLALLDTYATISTDLDGQTRSYINGIWVTPTWKREIRRWRNGQIRTIRLSTLNELLDFFDLEESWVNR
jgi:hypothetical protein